MKIELIKEEDVKGRNFYWVSIDDDSKQMLGMDENFAKKRFKEIVEQNCSFPKYEILESVEIPIKKNK